MIAARDEDKSVHCLWEHKIELNFKAFHHSSEEGIKIYYNFENISAIILGAFNENVLLSGTRWMNVESGMGIVESFTFIRRRFHSDRSLHKSLLR